MINLIPNEEKKRMRRGFYYRLMVVLLLALASAVFISVVAITPSYFISSIKKNLAESRLENQSNEPVHLPDQATEKLIAELNHKLTIIENEKGNTFFVSERVVNEIVLKKLSDIKIHQIYYEDSPAGGKKITIRGVAPSRERLLRFRRALEDDSFFKQVDLPISNFVRGSNIQFSLSLIPS
ncbi:MAG: hypothetical protein WD991_00065 [Candidatus Paceibacterota bacterium]